MLRSSQRPALTTVVGLVSALCLSPPAVAQEQAAAPPRDLDQRTAFALWVGAESVPAGIDRVCWETGRRGLGLAGASLVVPLGAVALEGRFGGHWRSGSHCVTAGPPLLPGTHTEQIPRLPPGSFATLDLRVRWMPSTSRAWYVAAGAGWAASGKDVPYLSTSVGARSPTRAVHLGVDVELALYRVPWEERTIQVADDGATETSRREYTEWAPTLSIRFSIEIPAVNEPPRAGS